MKKEIKIPRAQNPEDVGVSSGLIECFLEYSKDTGLELHSLMVVRHGKANSG